MADPTMTAEEMAPMGDERVAYWIGRVGLWRQERPSDWPILFSSNLNLGEMAALLARLGVEMIARKAAEARALPAPRLMESLEDVRAMPLGVYRTTLISLIGDHAGGAIIHRPDAYHGSEWYATGSEVPYEPRELVGVWLQGPIPEISTTGATVSGPRPDLDVPEKKET